MSALKDQTAIVTGAAQGIGRAIAEALAQEGCRLALVDVNLEGIEKTAREISEAHKAETLGLRADVTKLTEAEEMVKKTLDKWGRIDILINNAGVTKDNLLMRMSEEEWDFVLDINLKGVFLCTRAAVRPMLKARSGRIVNIASVVGQMGNAGQANYSASKGGVIALTKTCAREFASRGITVNAIAPGFIKTRMTEALSEEQKKKLSELIPLSRLGEPEDVANAALYLCLPTSSYITGHVLAVNGGMYM